MQSAADSPAGGAVPEDDGWLPVIRRWRCLGYVEAEVRVGHAASLSELTVRDGDGVAVFAVRAVRRLCPVEHARQGQERDRQQTERNDDFDQRVAGLVGLPPTRARMAFRMIVPAGT